ncbi:MAG: glutathione-dependent formaldehyde dehydrogenase [Candidatus Melainabacteria bacterium]|nr:MAG: glutathione-dependent formaldehyde dehydrogenase [Candidatus Melainabacteria bacterium]
MKALVFKGVGKIELAELPKPVLQDSTDAIVRIIAASICGTDLHMVRGSMSGMKPGSILGHEAVGIVEQVGASVQNFKEGDRVVVCSTIACGNCVYCQAEEYSSCDRANPNGPEAGTAFFGGPVSSGPFDGLQAEFARIPYADAVLVAIPEQVNNDDALLVSDVFPTGYMAAKIADVQEGDIVAVFGCGPVGQMAIASAKLLGASKVIAVDCLQDRLETAKGQGAMILNYNENDPVEALHDLSDGYGPDACIDAVGLDAEKATEGPASEKRPFIKEFSDYLEQKMLAPTKFNLGDQWRQGNAPSQVLQWCVESVRKSGVISIVGVYAENSVRFPIGLAMQKALTVRAANCSHRKYVPTLLKLIADGQFRPSAILTKQCDLIQAVNCYEHFDRRESGWLKVRLSPAA